MRTVCFLIVVFHTTFLARENIHIFNSIVHDIVVLSELPTCTQELFDQHLKLNFTVSDSRFAFNLNKSMLIPSLIQDSSFPRKTRPPMRYDRLVGMGVSTLGPPTLPNHVSQEAIVYTAYTFPTLVLGNLESDF